jgi:hypothetical protein
MNTHCKQCGKELVFTKVSRKDKKYCGNACQHAYQRKHFPRKPIPKPKQFFEIEYLQKGRSVSEIAKELCTSPTSISRWLKYYKIPARDFSTKGLKGWNAGKNLSDSTKEKIRQARLGTKHTEESKRKISAWLYENNPFKGKKHTEEFKKWMSESRMGDKSPAWKGGVWPLHKKIRATREIKLARLAALIRDDYTCQMCGIRKEKFMEVDHIKPFSTHPELRAAIDNLRTLCHECHKQTDTYGGKKSKKIIS